jgi:uncharacterized membrane-anchored protein
VATAQPVISTAAGGRIAGQARVDSRTKRLAKRLRPGDIAVIDHADLDALAARSLADRDVAAVVNARPFITGKYPNRGPAVLLAHSIPLFQLDDPLAFALLRDGQGLEIDRHGALTADGKSCGNVRRWDAGAVAAASEDARANLGNELEKFARNTLQYLDEDKDLLLDPVDVPNLPGIKMAGRHALVVVRGDGYKDDLALLQPYIRDVQPVLIAVDGGADALLELGHKPDIILGDMDSVSDEALRCGARIIVHAYARRGGEAPGMGRVRELDLPADTFPVPGTSEDAALMLAYEHNADLIAVVGSHSSLEDFLDKGRAGMASTFLVRLKLGQRLVDARGVCKLYQPKPSRMLLAMFGTSALLPFVVVVAHSPILRNMWQTIRLMWRLRFHH